MSTKCMRGRGDLDPDRSRGLFAMEAWHEPYASQRSEPLLAPSQVRWYLDPFSRRVPVHAMSTDEVRAMWRATARSPHGRARREYDGVQLASSNAKMIDQFLSPFYNAPTERVRWFAEGRARILELIRRHVAERAGADFTCTVKIPSPRRRHRSPPAPRGTRECGSLSVRRMGLRLGHTGACVGAARLDLSRGGIPSSLWKKHGHEEAVFGTARRRVSSARC